MCATFHNVHLDRIRIFVLPTSDWLQKTIAELLLSSKQLRFHEVHHHVICKFDKIFFILF